MITPRVGNIDLRVGSGVIAPPQPGGLVQLGGGPSQAGTYLQAQLAALGLGGGQKSVVSLMRIRVDELRIAFSPGGLGGVAFAVVSDALEVAAGGSAGTFLLSSTIPTSASVGAGPENGNTPHSTAVMPANGGFLWNYAYIDYTLGGAGNYESGNYLLTDAGVVVAGATQTNSYGSGASHTDPTNLLIMMANYNNSPYVTTPGGIIVDGWALFMDPAVSVLLSGMARNTWPVLGAPGLKASYAFSGNLNARESGAPPLIAAAVPGQPTSVQYLVGGICN